MEVHQGHDGGQNSSESNLQKHRIDSFRNVGLVCWSFVFAYYGSAIKFLTVPKLKLYSALDENCS